MKVADRKPMPEKIARLVAAVRVIIEAEPQAFISAWEFDSEFYADDLYRELEDAYRALVGENS